MSRFSNALGVWDIEWCEPKLELKPRLSDVKLFRNIMLQNGKNKALLFDKFGDFMWQLINVQYPEDCQVKNEHGENEVKVWVELNINKLFEESMIAFRWTTKDDLDKSKAQAGEELKKMMSDS